MEERKPDGSEYKNKSSIIVFGGSFAFGQFLEYNQTFTYKLSKILKRPVYNRAIPACGLQHMYMQTESSSLYKTIYPSPDTIIYIMIDDHYRRLYVKYFDFLNLEVNLTYSIKNKKLIMDNYKNPFKNFLNSLYTVKLLNHIFVKIFLENINNEDKITDDALIYFIESRKNLESNYNKKLNFVVVLYNFNQEKLINKLKNNGFTVITIGDLTSEDLWNQKYTIPNDGHPNEAAWDLIVPLLVKKLNL